MGEGKENSARMENSPATPSSTPRATPLSSWFATREGAETARQGPRPLLVILGLGLLMSAYTWMTYLPAFVQRESNPSPAHEAVVVVAENYNIVAEEAESEMEAKISKGEIDADVLDEKIRAEEESGPGVPVDYSPGVYVLKSKLLSNAFVWNDSAPIRTASDFPSVLDFDPKFWTTQGKKPVCVYSRTPRQDSLFRTNIMSMFGKNKFHYIIARSTNCQHHGSCRNAEAARLNKLCSGADKPTIRLLERIKCCQHDRYEKVLSRGMEFYDVLVSTGDEYCRTVSALGKAHFRTYSGVGLVRDPVNLRIAPEYLPLGPREEFHRVRKQHVLLAKDRYYTFNFIGSVTSRSRKQLGLELRSLAKKNPKFRSFVHIVQEWSKKLTRSNGYILPAEYRRIVMNSTFTLCPQGHNPEAYRIYEAAEAGSIPILVLDTSYKRHVCKGSFKPLIDSGAPFIFLQHWGQLVTFLESIHDDYERLHRMQANVMAWYRNFMETIANKFETVLETRFQDRIEHGKYTATAPFDFFGTVLDTQ